MQGILNESIWQNLLQALSSHRLVDVHMENTNFCEIFDAALHENVLR